MIKAIAPATELNPTRREDSPARGPVPEVCVHSTEKRPPSVRPGRGKRTETLRGEPQGRRWEPTPGEPISGETGSCHAFPLMSQLSVLGVQHASTESRPLCKTFI